MTAANPDAVPYVCDRCHQGVNAEDDGVFFISDEDRTKAVHHAAGVGLRHAQRLLAEHERHQAGQLVATSQAQAVDEFLQDMPVAGWQMVHDRCLREDENDELAWYVEAGRIRGFRALLGMALHLEKKDWVKSTDLKERLLEYSGGF